MNNMERTSALQQRLNVWPLERFPPCLSDSKGVHTKHGYRHLERLSHNQQQGALCLLRNSPAAFQTQSGAHRQFAHHHGHKPTGDHEGPEGINLLDFFFRRNQTNKAANPASSFSLRVLQDGQLELKELTAASLDRLLDGHNALQAQQGKLYEGQEQMEGSLRDNLLRLSQEKALIASGQELVAQLIQGITQKMGEVDLW